MFKLTAKQEKGFVKLKFIPFLFLISVFLFASSCESIKKKAVQSGKDSASRSLAGLPKSSISHAEFNQLKRKEGEILSGIKGGPLKVVYSFLINQEAGRICYVESFKTRDIVPPFAKPASYKEALSVKRPSLPKCSNQEYGFMSYHQNTSLLAGDGVELAGIGVGGALAITAVCGLGYFRMDDELKSYLQKIEMENRAVGQVAVGAMSCVAGAVFIYHYAVLPAAIILQDKLEEAHEESTERLEEEGGASP